MKVFVALVVLLVLAGCAAGRGSAGSTVAEETTARFGQETAAHSAREQSTIIEGGDHLPRPWDSTLSYGGREVKGSLGSYCWSMNGSSASAGGACVDTTYIVPPKRKTLSVPSGSEMVFHYGGRRPPKTVQIRARPLGKKGGSHPTLKAHGSGVERTIPAGLPPGEYVLDVFVEEPQTANQVVYYFRVMVE